MNHRTEVRPDMRTNMPRRIAALRVDRRGYPVPWFVQEVEGREPDFRIVDSHKLRQALRFSRCWICGGPLGVNKTFVVGPMCVVSRVSAEPPAHAECALFAAHFCPFLALPHAKRREANLPEHAATNPSHLLHNPGVIAVWTTRRFTTFRNAGSLLCRFAEPVSVQWFAEGRHATRDEVIAGFEKGLPALLALDDTQWTEAEAFAVIAPHLPAQTEENNATTEHHGHDHSIVATSGSGHVPVAVPH